MKAILINPRHKAITEVDHPGTLSGTRELLQCRMIDCAIRFNNTDVLYVDDEGLFEEELHCFIIRNSPFQPIVGNGLVVGSDGEGGDADCKYTLEEVKNRVTFITPQEAQLLAWKP